jgi:hypothetical protein
MTAFHKTMREIELEAELTKLRAVEMVYRGSNPNLYEVVDALEKRLADAHKHINELERKTYDSYYSFMRDAPIEQYAVAPDEVLIPVGRARAGEDDRGYHVTVQGRPKDSKEWLNFTYYIDKPSYAQGVPVSFILEEAHQRIAHGLIKCLEAGEGAAGREEAP